ncbi:hypothetical protein DAA51_33730 [Bradyrhizobium sp. WBAH10]|nr:hypothetical protein [Bradyrhizobium sp. WBAH30]MDD1547365.1 hypothetical protein [Bradyrhizobium sp. WBAH41]MDD1561003.1 hypothetical protein [Bradyrhizobium sp. WBAH23]MDD1594372.1 hypothetical protein [Bradyrhizobium sp. WBAH42]NRB91905.1 hypothetical protein [Bradyrhizobium sp. WBAH10]QCJ92919.1 hypothetical protein DAA57_33975 [Bradyrhizobium yuanmingense]
MHKPQFRHAACLIATSIITDVLMMLGRTRRTFSPPAECVGAPWFGGVSFLSNAAHQLTTVVDVLPIAKQILARYIRRSTIWMVYSD